MAYRFLTCDVFTDKQFGGNPLAVFPEAEGLSEQQMQTIAREFNYSETTFVLPPEQGNTRRVRIFTPGREVPFAGHPNVGTACALVHDGMFDPELDSDGTGRCTLRFEELAGVVPVDVVRRADGGICAELTAPAPLTCGEPLPLHVVATALSLQDSEIVVSNHQPMLASVGLPFVMVEVPDPETLARAAIDMTGFNTLNRLGVPSALHVYCRTDAEFDIRCRMFAPLLGLAEDPATGSANCALAGLLTELDAARDGDFAYRIAQGVEMGRPSTLEAKAGKRDGKAHTIRIGGRSVMVMQGTINV